MGTTAERSKSEPGIGAMLVDATNDEMTAARGDVQAARGLVCIEQDLQGRTTVGRHETSRHDVERAPGQCANRDHRGAILSMGTTGRTCSPGSVSARRVVSMVQPASTIVPTGLQERKLMGWAPAAT